ncbi:hypothetical protein Tco_0363860 [Tanacetum coccineum]
MHEMRKNYNGHGGNHASKNNMNDDTPMYERHEANSIQSGGYQIRDSHDLYSHQSHYNQPQSNNDSEKSLTELNNDVKNDLEDFKRCIRSMRTVHDKLFDRDDQSKTDLEKLITKFLDGERVSNMFVKNSVNDIIIKMKKNKKNCQTIYKNMERKIDAWSKSQNVSLKQTDRTDTPPLPAQSEQVNAVFTESGKSDDSSKMQEDPPPLIIGNGTAGNGGAQNRAGKMPCQDKMLLMHAENGAGLDEGKLLFWLVNSGNTLMQIRYKQIHNAGPSNASMYSESLNRKSQNSGTDFSKSETLFNDKLEFKQKESKFLTDFSNLKHLNDKLENKLHSQDQSIQTVHMMLNPTQVYDQKTKTALGRPRASRDFKRVNITPPNYSKENFMATFTPQTQLTFEQVFWSMDLEKQKAEELKANAPPLHVLSPATVYPPNTPIHLVPRTLPTTSQVNIGLYVITQLFWDFEKTCKRRITPTGITEGERGFEQTKWCYLTEVIPFFNLLKEQFDEVQKSLVTEVRAMKVVFENLEAEVDQNEIDLKSGEIERKNLLITNENLIAECLSKDVFYTATDSVLNVSRFSDMHDAFTIAQKRIADLESENFNLRNKIQNDDHDSMIKHFSKLEVEHFNLQLKYQNLKERFGNKKPVTSSDAPSFDSLFVIGK